jgi:hypothetical protein
MPPVLLAFSYFSDRVSSLCLGRPGLQSSYLSNNRNYRQTLLHPDLLWDGVLLTFCLGWPSTMRLLISASLVAGITDTSYCPWSTVNFLMSFYWIEIYILRFSSSHVKEK